MICDIIRYDNNCMKMLEEFGLSGHGSLSSTSKSWMFLFAIFTKSDTFKCESLGHPTMRAARATKQFKCAHPQYSIILFDQMSQMCKQVFFLIYFENLKFLLWHLPGKSYARLPKIPKIKFSKTIEILKIKCAHGFAKCHTPYFFEDFEILEATWIIAIQVPKEYQVVAESFQKFNFWGTCLGRNVPQKGKLFEKLYHEVWKLNFTLRGRVSHKVKLLGKI